MAETYSPKQSPKVSTTRHTVQMAEAVRSIERAVQDFARHMDDKCLTEAAAALGKIVVLGLHISDTANLTLDVLKEDAEAK